MMQHLNKNRDFQILMEHFLVWCVSYSFHEYIINIQRKQLNNEIDPGTLNTGSFNVSWRDIQQKTRWDMEGDNSTANV